MRTAWTGKELILLFESGGQVVLSKQQTMEFDEWVKDKILDSHEP